MNTELKTLLRRNEGHYLSESDADQIRAFGRCLERRTVLHEHVEAREAAILDHVVRAVKARRPELDGPHWPMIEAKIRRDQGLVLRYAALAMLLMDPNLIRDKLSVWLRTILFALCDADTIVESYEELIAACREHLDAEASEALVPYLEVHLDEFRMAKGVAS